jgi:UDPglucose 6-dehydrogenase
MHQYPISEHGLGEVLERHSRRLHYVTNQLEALDQALRFVFVAVGIPPAEDGSADLSNVDRVIDRMPDSSNYAIVMKSTVPPGTGRRILEHRRALGKRFAYVSCPDDLRRPDRVVIGSRGECWAAPRVRALHAELDCRPDLRSHRHHERRDDQARGELPSCVCISFANEVANLCEEIGADAREVLHGIGLDSRIGPDFLEAGVGFGGSWFSKDVKALHRTALDHGCELTLPTALLEINERRAERVIDKLERSIGPLDGHRIDARAAASTVLARVSLLRRRTSAILA